MQDNRVQTWAGGDERGGAVWETTVWGGETGGVWECLHFKGNS